MQNRIQYTYGAVVTQYGQAIVGVETHAATLGLVIVAAPAMNTLRAALIASEHSAQQQKAELNNRQDAFQLLFADARKHLFVARDSLKLHLGKEYSPAWDETGFVGSLTVPRKFDSVMKLLHALNAYLVAHPTHENATFNVTAGTALLYANDLMAGLGGVNTQIATWQLALATRDAKAEQVRTDIRALIKELRIRMDPMDERWAAFGFNKPGQLQTPAVPQKVSAAMGAPGEVNVKWEKAARAKSYRIWKRVVTGETEEFIPLGSTGALVFIIEGVTPGETLEIYVSASNNGGESQRSEKSEVLVTA